MSVSKVLFLINRYFPLVAVSGLTLRKTFHRKRFFKANNNNKLVRNISGDSHEIFSLRMCQIQK